MDGTATKLVPATGDSVWTADEMRDSKRWIYDVTPRDVENMDRALAHVHTNNLRLPFGKADFPLGDFAETMHELLHEMEDGSGVVLMRGIPVEKYGLENSRLVYWGLGQHLGYALAQTPRAELLIDVKDTGGDQYKDPTVRGYHTDRRLPFHNDQGDVVGLLCIRGAKAGGLSCIASAAAVHNEILRTRPDLLEILYQPYYSDIRGEQPKGRKPYYAEPRFTMWNGKLFCQHGRTYIDSAQRFPEVPRLTPQMIEAMELIDKLANGDRYRLDMDFHPGDIQFLNNRVVVHSRTDFQDYAEPERKRHLLRLWLRTPGYDTLPAFFKPRFEDMDYWLKHPLARVA
jgi:Taurine catabolism dioxygenase TauD, TfdA family